MIKHHPLLDIHAIEQFYSTKDGVGVKYVCTSALGSEEFAGDIFFRETPHPEFGNRYFRITRRFEPMSVRAGLLIGNADKIEDVDFSMIEGMFGWEYSQHRHDYRDVPGANVAIDGGRAYCRRVGDIDKDVRVYRVKDGVFVEPSS